MPRPCFEGVTRFELCNSRQITKYCKEKRRSAVPFITGLQDGAFSIFIEKGGKHAKQNEKQRSPRMGELQIAHALRGTGAYTGAAGKTGLQGVPGVFRLPLPRPRLHLLAGQLHEERDGTNQWEECRTRVKIYQINLSRDRQHVGFRSLEETRAALGRNEPDPSVYDEVFSAELDPKSLEQAQCGSAHASSAAGLPLRLPRRIQRLRLPL